MGTTFETGLAGLGMGGGGGLLLPLGGVGGGDTGGECPEDAGGAVAHSRERFLIEAERLAACCLARQLFLAEFEETGVAVRIEERHVLGLRCQDSLAGRHIEA